MRTTRLYTLALAFLVACGSAEAGGFTGGAGGGHTGLASVSTTGAGLSGNGTAGVPLQNTGVTSCVSGTGVNCSASTGAVTVSANLAGGTAPTGQAIGSVTPSGGVTFTEPEDSRARTFIKSDFCGGTALTTNSTWDGIYFGAVSGTGAAFATSGEAGHDCIVSLLMGTTTSGRASLITGANGNNTILLGGGTVTVDVVLREPVISNGTDTYTARCGLIDTTNAESTDGVYFKTDSAASANWRIVTVSNTTKTEQDTSPAVTVTGGAWFHGRFVVNAAASSVTFYSVATNGTATAEGTISTNIPSGAGRQTALGCMDLKSAGTTATQVDLDLIQYEDDYTSGR